MKIIPKNPQSNWIKNYLNPSILHTKSYQLEKCNQRTKIDQNESPFDWPDDLKEEILSELKKTQWNRYPTSYCEDLRSLVADYSEVVPSCVFLCAGSNYHVSLIINLLCRNLKGKLIVARPSFPLYEQHCMYENIKYESWNLNSKLEYDLKLLPQITPGSVIIFASPNNPTGSVLSKEKLRQLLLDNPQAYFIVDEAYYEFNKYSYTDLLSECSNLIILRTFSKAFAGAGVRLGYTIASKPLIDELNKLTLPFMINHFSLIAMKAALSSKSYKNNIKKQVQTIIDERDEIYNILKNKFFIPASNANFLYLTTKTPEKAQELDFKIKNLGLQGRLILAQNFIPGVRVSIETNTINNQLKKI
jgi:histidinol-phosphate aminotransferase